MDSFRMNRTVVSKSSFLEADDHVTFYNDKTPLERLNYACDIINSIFDTTPEKKVDKTIFSARKHAKLIQY
jgi:translation initiation factor 2B subunit (eIF-2B alpha/beta/delta family)